MSGTIVEVEIPVTEFALCETLTAVDGLEFEVERVVAHDEGRVMPFVWGHGDGIGHEETESLLEDDSSVDRAELLADLDDEWLYRMEWVSRIETLIQILIEEEGTILAASGDSDGWNLRLLFPTRESLSRTYEYCEENGVALTILNIYRFEDGREGRFGLTEDQLNVLTLAYERGYFQVPREITAEELADELNVSHQSISERLRRAYENLVENTVILGEGADDPHKR